MKKIISGIGFAALVLAGSFPIASADVRNVTDESTVSVASTNRFNLLMRINNNAQITNNVTAIATTGGNVIRSEDDMENVSLVTGNADAVIEVSNMANNSHVSVAVDSAMPNHSVTNVDDESRVVIDDREVVDFDIQENQTVAVENNVPVYSDTGMNRIISENDMENVTVRTGTATAATLVENIFNFSSTEITRRMAR